MGLERACNRGQHVLDKQDRDICHVAIDNTPWTCMTVTSSSTQLVDIPINRLEQARLGI